MSSTMTKTQVDSQVEGISPDQIRSIQLADGWHNVTDVKLVQFAVGKANSPISPTKLYPALQYRNEQNMQVTTALRQILGFSEDQSQGQKGYGNPSGTSTSNSGRSGSPSNF